MRFIRGLWFQKIYDFRYGENRGWQIVVSKAITDMMGGDAVVGYVVWTPCGFRKI